MNASFIWMNTVAVSAKPEPGTVGTLLWSGKCIKFTVSIVDPWGGPFLGSMIVTFAAPVQGLLSTTFKYSLPVMA